MDEHQAEDDENISCIEPVNNETHASAAASQDDSTDDGRFSATSSSDLDANNECYRSLIYDGDWVLYSFSCNPESPTVRSQCRIEQLVDDVSSETCSAEVGCPTGVTDNVTDEPDTSCIHVNVLRENLRQYFQGLISVPQYRPLSTTNGSSTITEKSPSRNFSTFISEATSAVTTSLIYVILLVYALCKRFVGI